MAYNCLRCGYEGETKYNLERHLNIAKPCSEILSAIPREDVLGIVQEKRNEFQAKTLLENRTCGGCNKVFGSTNHKNRHLAKSTVCIKFIETKEDMNKKDAEIVRLREELEKTTIPETTRPIDINIFNNSGPLNIDISHTQNVSNQTTQNISAPKTQIISAPTTQNISAPTTQNISAPTTQNFTGPVTQNIINFKPTINIFRFQNFEYLLSNSDLMDKTVGNQEMMDLLKAMYMDKQRPASITVRAIGGSDAVYVHEETGWKRSPKSEIYDAMCGDGLRIVKRYFEEKNGDYFEKIGYLTSLIRIWIDNLDNELYQNGVKELLPGMKEKLDELMRIHCRYSTPVVPVVERQHI